MTEKEGTHTGNLGSIPRFIGKWPLVSTDDFLLLQSLVLFASSFKFASGHSFLLPSLHPSPVLFNYQIPAPGPYISHASSSFLPHTGSEPKPLALTSSFT